MSSPTLIAELVGLLLYGNAVVLLHELGHAISARPAGLRVTSFGIGLGSPIARVHLSRSRVIFLGRLPIGGSCTAIPAQLSGDRRWIFYCGGLFGQAILGVALFFGPSWWWLERMAVFNALVFATNLLPWRLRGHRSDGQALIDLVRPSRRRGGLIGQREALERLAARERAIGSRVGYEYAETLLAWAQLQRGLPDPSYLSQCTPQGTDHPWLQTLQTLVSAEAVRSKGQPLRALQLLRAAERTGLDSADLLQLFEARALIDLGDQAAAEQLLVELSTLPGPIGSQATCSAVRLHVDRSGSPLRRAVAAALDRARGPLIDPIDAAASLEIGAVALQASGDVDLGGRAHEAARWMVDQIRQDPGGPAEGSAEDQALQARYLSAQQRPPARHPTANPETNSSTEPPATAP